MVQMWCRYGARPQASIEFLHEHACEGVLAAGKRVRVRPYQVSSGGEQLSRRPRRDETQAEPRIGLTAEWREHPVSGPRCQDVADGCQKVDPEVVRTRGEGGKTGDGFRPSGTHPGVC